jgi:hypothetical protein
MFVIGVAAAVTAAADDDDYGDDDFEDYADDFEDDTDEPPITAPKTSKVGPSNSSVPKLSMGSSRCEIHDLVTMQY